MKLFIIILFSFICIYSFKEPDENEQIIMNIYYNIENKNFTLRESKNIDKNAIAYAIYNRSYERTGWDFLAISTYDKKDGKYNDSDKAYAMGYIEGYLTKDKIYSYLMNMKHYLLYNNNLTIPENLKKFFQINIEYMKEKSYKNKDSDEYWENVYYIYKQLEGLYDGYLKLAEEEEKFTFLELIIFSLVLSDSTDAMYYQEPESIPNFYEMNIEDVKRFISLKSHCSAIIKLAEDFSDIWFGHNMWATYTSMIRIFKEYRFISNKGNEKSKTIVFSSYPGTLASLDDFYILDSKLLVMETTNANFNNSLYQFIKPEALLTWVRAMVSNRLASSAEEWTNIFKKENSGTYNNQFMILDINKIDLKNKTIPQKSLMIIEQIPGDFEINDVSNKLKEGYWPSYNVPYSKNFYQKCGYENLIQYNRNYILEINYDYCSRAQIFKRDQNTVKSSNDLKKLLRYNNYRYDNYSCKYPTLTLACRSDLIEGNYSYCFGATDVKFVSVKELLEGKFYAHIISGPTNDQQPTFSWSNTTCNKSNPEKWYLDGLIDTWNFDWVDYKIQFFKFSKKVDGDDKDSDNKVLIICLCIGCFILIINIVIIIFCIRNKLRSDNLNENISQIVPQDDDKDKLDVKKEEFI